LRICNGSQSIPSCVGKRNKAVPNFRRWPILQFPLDRVAETLPPVPGPVSRAFLPSHLTPLIVGPPGAHVPPEQCCRSSALSSDGSSTISQTRFDAAFAALSVVTQRGVLEQLGRDDASITDLAEKFHMSLTGMKKHVGLLEQAGLVTMEKAGRVRICKRGRRRLEEEAAWTERYRQLWATRFSAAK
jgi:DNA-binding transcriptional ArsR family regulator